MNRHQRRGCDQPISITNDDDPQAVREMERSRAAPPPIVVQQWALCGRTEDVPLVANDSELIGRAKDLCVHL